jgi:ABC-2 type transport system permease protein
MNVIDLQRLRGFLRKEWIQIWRDPSSIVVAVVLPMIMLVLFGFGVSLDAKLQPAAIVVETAAPEAQDFLASLRATAYIVPRLSPDRPTATTWLRAGTVKAIVVLGEDFGERLQRGNAAPIQVIVDGTDANTARLLSGYVQGVWAIWVADRQRASGVAAAPAIQVQARIWFNEAVDSHRSIVPGLIAVIMTLIGALLTALVIAREWERGTMEALLTTPLTRAELLLGKLIPYFCLGMGGMVVSTIFALTVFGIPFKGSALVLLLAGSLFMLVTLGFGLMASTLTRNQFTASIVALTATMMPAILLSGFIFDIRSMAPLVQVVTYIVPARYFVEVLKTLFLAGTVWPVILPNMAALAVMAAILLTITVVKTKRSLE